ncbi:zinc-dependent alcohol dehydrogenase [Alkalihalobacterium alkalinitrilicum]|uniref:zinc-dependent alcohol dehydrogenase n=1 Tax=Alkalihalobacterium alkalinitrilicum TaxID=427920 RepID=UPI001EE3FA5C|nr:alcohol dehydrogenase catalytic domain-containing protein [Alkalihalobacterium alkalinitrilicum]
MNDNLMKALVYEGPKEMNMREIPIPEANIGEVLIQVERVGICGSELGGYLGHNSLRVPPLVMGHEFSGEIIEASEDSKFKVGDRVTVNPLISCGNCSDCKAGSPNLCVHRKLIGAHVPGAFAKYVTVPEGNVYHLPDHLSYEEGALVEPFACAVRISRIVQLTAFDKLLIVGAGPIGLFVLQTAKVLGINDVVVLEINPKRLEIVKELGGIPVSSEEQLKNYVTDRGFNVSVDAVGLDSTRQLCLNMTKPGGRVVFTGLHAENSELPINLAIRNELSLYGSFGYNPIDFELALNWISSRKVNMEKWIQNEALENGSACFETLIHDPGKIAKFMLNL